MPRQLKVAVTGSAGSGKSTVCRSLRDKGLAVIDLDSVSRETVKPGSPALEAVRSVFGSAALGPDGCLDRSYLRSLIISDSSQKKKLEDILHPLIIAMMNEKMDHAFALGNSIIIVEVPLLFETGMDSMFDVTIAVLCDPGTRINRLSKRDGVSTEDAAALVSIQMPDEEKARRAGYLIQNSGDLESLVQESGRLYNYLKSLRLDN